MISTVRLASLLILSGLCASVARADEGPRDYGRLDLDAAISRLPAQSDKPFVDARLLDNGPIGVRVFRVYHRVPRHHHAFSSTYLVIQSGRARFRLEGKETFVAGKGDMVFWERGVDHEVTEILEAPLVFISVDAPTRREGDARGPARR